MAFYKDKYIYNKNIFVDSTILIIEQHVFVLGGE
jgi:hypothetical protein